MGEKLLKRMLFRFSLLLLFCNLAHINADERGQEIRIINGKEVTDPYKYADGRRHRLLTIKTPGKKSPPKQVKKTKTTKGNNGTKKKTAAPTESPTPVECPEHLNPAPPGKKWALIDDVDSKPSSKPSGKPSRKPSGKPSSKPSSKPSGKPSWKPTAEHSERPTVIDIRD